MKKIFDTIAPFTKTRLILTGWYTLILFLILLAFSLVLATTYSNDVTRIVLRQDFGNHVPRTLSPRELRLVLAQVKELRNTSRLDIIVIDAITLILGGGLSFFLAGKTLRPIQKSMIGQKVFVADASHELKSPVTTIQSACEVLLRSRIKTKETYQETIELVYEQSVRLGKLVSDLLSLSVLDAGDTKPLERSSLSDIVRREVEVTQPLAQKAKVSLKTDISPNVIINGHKDKIQQLVTILLDNAVKYTSQAGKITIKVIPKPNPQLIVEDTGIGVPLEKQNDIFRRFYQADTSHSGKGAGLGLAIAQAIMQYHKGKIAINSTVGKGSIFTCTFPSV